MYVEYNRGEEPDSDKEFTPDSDEGMPSSEDDGDDDFWAYGR